MSKRGRIPLLLGLGLLLGGVAAYIRLVQKPAEDTQNYTVTWTAPKGWEEAEQSPMTLFRYKHPKEETYIRCSLTQTAGDVPPGEQTAESLASHHLETTNKNQKGWKAERLKDIRTPELSFALVRREQTGQAVVTAFAVEGRTTVMVSLTSSGEKASEQAKAGIDEFESVLVSLRAKPTVVR